MILLLVRQTKTADRHITVVRHLGLGPAIHSFGLAHRTVSGCDGEGVHIARVVEVDELLEALYVTVVKELLLEVGSRGLGGGALRGCHRHVARRRGLHQPIADRRELCPGGVRIRSGHAPQERSQSQVPVAEAGGVGREAEEIRLVLVVDGIPGIQGQAEVGGTETGEQRCRVGRGSGVLPIRGGAIRRCGRGRSAVQVTRVAIRLATEQVVTGLFLRGQGVRGRRCQRGIKFRGESADCHRLLVSVQRLRPMVEDYVGAGPLLRTERHRSVVRTEYRSSSRCGADPLGLRWKVDVQGTLPPNFLHERAVLGL